MLQEGGPFRGGLLQGKVEEGFVAHRGSPGTDTMVSKSISAKRPAKASKDFQKILEVPELPAAYLVSKPGPGVGPVAVGRGGRDVEELRRLLAREPGEVAQLDQASLHRLGLSQLSQGLVEG